VNNSGFLSGVAGIAVGNAFIVAALGR